MTPGKFGKILNKLPKNKVELKKIQLNIISQASSVITDLEKIENIKKESINEATKAKEILVGLDKELIAARRDLNTVIERERFISASEEFIKNGKKILNEIKESANALGVNPDKITEYSELDNAIGLAEFDLKDLQKAIDLAKDTLKRYG